MSDGSSSPKRARLELDEIPKDDVHDKYNRNRDADDQGSYSNSRKRRAEGGEDEEDLKDCDDMKSKNLAGDAGRREHTLVMRLTNKEQEVQECMNQIQEMKQQKTQNMAQLRNLLLDPAINLVFQRMAKEMEEHKEKLKQKQNELNAWKFTADSHTGMRLMGKCRMLLQENEELGKVISSGRTARLEGEISLHKALVTEMKKNQKELDEFVGELEEDVEGMQGMIFMLQQQLKEAREQITRLQQENEQLRTLQLPSEPEPGGGVQSNNGAGGDNSLSISSSTSRHPAIISSSSHDASSTDPVSSTNLSSSLNLRVPSAETIITTVPPLSNSSDSALTPVESTVDEFSPGTFSVKVTPDSGIQTQEEDEAMDSVSVEDGCDGNSLPNDNHFVDTDLTSGEVDRLGKSRNGKGDDDGLRTSPLRGDDGDDSKQTDKKSDGVHNRTSNCSSPSGPLTNTNGDINVTQNDDGVDQTLSGDDDGSGGGVVKKFSKDGIQEENKIDSKLTPSSNDDVNDDKIEDLSECLGLTQECPTVNF